MVNVILCGGSGTRMWPLSRSLFPKQFVPLFDGRSLYEHTISRNTRFCESFIVVTNADLVFMALGQFEKMQPEADMSAIIEPAARNTAPAIALAALAQKDPDELLFVTPSDHMINDDESYAAAIAAARKAAQLNKLVTFGIVPSYPETGYGYIEVNTGADVCDMVFAVSAFKEKPDAAVAKSYLEKGNYYWNSGMFMFRAGAFLKELETSRPDIFTAARKAYETHHTSIVSGYEVANIEKEAMLDIPSDSVDYAVMEKSSQVATVISPFTWNDLGSFDSLYDLRDKDAQGNTVDRNYTPFESQNNLVVGSRRKIVSLNIRDSIIIDTDDALLVAARGSSQKVKEVVDTLKSGSTSEQDLVKVHLTAYRPWGSYRVLEDRPGYKIKQIMVTPGSRLSLQKHAHRSEHWVVVSGRADVTIGLTKTVVNTNESVYIPAGEIHRLGNSTKEELVIIETQVGENLSEDDIIRIEDDYKRMDT